MQDKIDTQQKQIEKLECAIVEIRREINRKKVEIMVMNDKEPIESQDATTQTRIDKRMIVKDVENNIQTPFVPHKTDAKLIDKSAKSPGCQSGLVQFGNESIKYSRQKRRQS